MKINLSNVLMILTLVGIVGFGSYAFAGGGMGYGSRGWGHMGRGGYHMGWGEPGYGYGDLNQDEYKKLDEKRQAFFKETEDLRQKIYEKELALEQELAKENPDGKKAARIHKELAELETKFEQKQIEYDIATRKINPRIGRGYMGRGGMMGYGRGGMMMDHGPGGYGPGGYYR